MNLRVQSFEQLEVYRESFALAKLIYHLSRDFPCEEKYALTDQVRRASRSIGANIAESWAKRKYPAHFLSKLTDADSELQETKHWISVADSCEYLEKEALDRLRDKLTLIGRLLGAMILESDSFCSTA